jgi:hypothetical protein
MASVPPLEFAALDTVLAAWEKEDAELERREQDRKLLRETQVISLRDARRRREVEDLFDEMMEAGALAPGDGLSIRRPR